MNKSPETLFITKALTEDIYFLEDSHGSLIGRFKSEQEARDWCKENGYRARTTN